MRSSPQEILSRLLEQHGSWALAAAALGERVETLVAVHAGQPVPDGLRKKLDVANDIAASASRTTRRT